MKGDTNGTATQGALSKRDLAVKVKELRAEVGVTQAQLAAHMDYTTSTISKAENFRRGDGMTGPRIAIIEALSDAWVEGPFYRV